MARKGIVGLAGVVLMLVVVAGPPGASGTSYNPLTPDRDGAATMTCGDVVYLFHGDAGEAPRTVLPGAVLPVRHPRADGGSDVVGAVRIVESISATCFRGEVSAGTIRPYDVLQTGGATCLVVPSKDPCHPTPER